MNGGAIGLVQNGDMVTLNCDTQELTLELSAAELAARPHPPRPADAWGSGQGLFGLFRRNAALAEEGASPLLSSMPS
jgi:phosphogluconate dehydratase